MPAHCNHASGKYHCALKPGHTGDHQQYIPGKPAHLVKWNRLGEHTAYLTLKRR